MSFGPLPLDEALGAILAHSIPLASGKLAKGRRLSAGDLERLRDEGVERVIVRRLEEGDRTEDEAAALLAAAIKGTGLEQGPAATGRVNFYAAANGLFVADKAAVDRFNRVDPAITLACLADRSDVRTGDLVATIKIIPLAVSAASLEAAIKALQTGEAFSVSPYRPHAVHLLATELPSLKRSVMDKTVRVLDARLERSGSLLVDERRVRHEAAAVAEALRAALAEKAGATHGLPPLLVIFGASAVCDPEDVIPQAIRLAGGIVERVGLPVDPGNLLVLGHIGEVPVIGAPGCARSPKDNGFDWVLNGILAGLPPSSDDMAGWGVGGLLMEIPSRPLPRLAAAAAGAETKRPDLGIVVLAAGRASRMGEGGPHKLLATFEGEALVRRVVRQAVEADCGPVFVVTGHRAEEIARSLEGLGVERVDNPAYQTGMASSLRAGLLAAEASGLPAIMVLLADMPGVATADIRHLAETLRNTEPPAIIRAVADGQRGNPVILPAHTFEALKALEGDIGARAVIESAGIPVIDVEIGAAARLDVDTPEAVIAAGGTLRD
ncbi:4-diphosphocytidyl-2C-methyl-D-erythritol kinase [Rhizobium sp. Root274]|uniref:NTP transferase domain-containing protein n=1 Tax=unclassified Rhizobium TaxID=2613769 RepID=UPI000713839D|nr:MULTISPECIES: molybdopterin-binding/glycosyltransferase family 2 protein [unclassified Rhizobium]KQW28645.1 4-diphosphocytidyl-2C-methyl-D-erythritol kinase [Rhizobium sp. Root1240]KRD28846.1 4-diphosphocytidyl-2C-methyl-D-erythritol kinase [Rhizobium sp. Root274]